MTEFTVFERLVELGEPDWFGLGDRDLATCLRRRELLAAGVRQTLAQEQISRALGASARVLPMCDEPVRTRLRIDDGWRTLQEFMVRDHGQPAIAAVEFDGVDEASISAEVESSISEADIVVIGPSNPVISIGPILALPGMRALLSSAAARVVAVSPFVAGETIKGPTDNCMRAVGAEPSASGVARLYEGLIDGLVADAGDPRPAEAGVPVLAVPTLMADAGLRRGLAEQVLAFGTGLTS